MARFNLEDLLKKEKEELESIKTALDIYQSEDKYAFERKKFKTENLRFFAIAVMTSIISLGSAYFIELFKQENQSKSDLKKEFAELKKQFLFEKDKTKQNEIACALANFDNFLMDKSITNAKGKYQVICKASEGIRKESDKISQTTISTPEINIAVTKIDELDKKVQNLKTKETSASGKSKLVYNTQIGNLNKSIDSITQKFPSLQTAAKSSENIEQYTQKIEATNQTMVKTQSTFSKSEVFWFKTGYWLQFGNYRILLLYLDKNLGIEVEICKTTGSEVCQNPLLTKAWVKYGSPLQFSDAGKTYKINLESIGHAGSNPFKLAAYITFETSY